MLKIGDFSQLSQIGIHALRNYDKIGLLQPSIVDKFTGYRYYTLQQLPRAHRIMALKAMGLSLEQISIMLDQEMSVDDLRGMFRLKQAEIEQRVREDQKRLAMIEFHINMLNAEDKMSELDVVMKAIDPFKALYIRIKANEGVHFETEDNLVTNSVIHETGIEVNQVLAERNIKPIAPWVDIRYGDEINLEDYEYAFVIPVDKQVTADPQLPKMGVMMLREMPAVHAATTMFAGRGIEGIVQKSLERLTLLRRWAIENDYTRTDEIRIVHHKSFTESDWLMEFQLVVEPQLRDA